jgi:hypothetical protein
MPELHPSAGHEESRPSVAMRHSRLQAHLPLILLQGKTLPPPPKKKMSLCAILAGSWDSILTFFTNDDIDWPCRLTLVAPLTKMAIRRDQWFKKVGRWCSWCCRAVFVWCDVFWTPRQPSSDDVEPSCFILDFSTNHQFIWDGSILCVCV